MKKNQNEKAEKTKRICFGKLKNQTRSLHCQKKKWIYMPV